MYENHSLSLSLLQDKYSKLLLLLLTHSSKDVPHYVVYGIDELLLEAYPLLIGEFLCILYIFGEVFLVSHYEVKCFE